MPGRVETGQPAKADETFQERDGIEFLLGAHACNGDLLSQHGARLPCHAHQRRAPEPVAQRHERLQDGREVGGAVLRRAIQHAARDLRMADDEFAAPEQLAHLAIGFVGREVPQRLLGGATHPAVSAIDLTATRAAARGEPIRARLDLRARLRPGWEEPRAAARSRDRMARTRAMIDASLYVGAGRPRHGPVPQSRVIARADEDGAARF